MNILGIIPARGGSKGVPGKNIKLLNNKPLIAYTIEEAKKSKYLNKVILSTDDKQIAEVGRKFGADIPFMRPHELAQDDSKAIDTYKFTLEKLKNDYNYQADILVVLQPTSPLRSHNDIDEAIELFLEKDADSVISMCEVEHSPYWYKNVNDNCQVKPFVDIKNHLANRQELPKVYRPNGAVYVFKTNLIINNYDYYTENTYAYIMSQEKSIDIDTKLDFILAETLINLKNEY